LYDRSTGDHVAAIVSSAFSAVQIGSPGGQGGWQRFATVAHERLSTSERQKRLQHFSTHGGVLVCTPGVVKFAGSSKILRVLNVDPGCGSDPHRRQLLADAGLQVEVSTAWTKQEEDAAVKGVVVQAPLLDLLVSVWPEDKHIAVPANMTAQKLVRTVQAAVPKDALGKPSGDALMCPYAFGGTIKQRSEESRFTLAALGITDGYKVQLSSKDHYWPEYEGTEGRTPPFRRR
jgi:hypothetical protein